MADRSEPDSLLEHLRKPPNLSHFRRLTTPLGIVQHARGSEPDLSHGYSIDDSARALIVCIWYTDLYGPRDVRDIAQIYLQHIEDAQLSNGRFHNFKDKYGKFLDEEGSQDAFGRAVWALGVAQKSTLVDKSRARAAFDRALPHVTSLDFPRSIAFTLLGVQAVGRADLVLALGKQLARIYEKCAREDWKWFETCVRYSNGILPYSLLLTGDAELEKVGLTSLQFLNEVSRVDGVPSPIGNKGWYCYGGKRAIFDQQCIDAADMVLANLAAFKLTHDHGYRNEAEEWFGWFHSNNIKKTVMVTEDGGCFDGINEDRINTNQGAESVLAYLLAYLDLTDYARLRR